MTIHHLPADDRLSTEGPGPAVQGLHQPYAQPRLNFLYNLLFCDDAALFKNGESASDGPPWNVLLAERTNVAALREIAHNESQEGRVRALAFNRLRSAGEAVAAKTLLGVIIEVSMPDGLDVLAAFSEGGVRYLNRSGGISVFEGEGNPVEDLAQQLVAVSQPVVDRIGPWDQPRLPPPAIGNVRLTFLVSDGLYFGEGPFAALQQDNMAGPILAKAIELLERVVDLSV